MSTVDLITTSAEGQSFDFAAMAPERVSAVCGVAIPHPRLAFLAGLPGVDAQSGVAA